MCSKPCMSTPWYAKIEDELKMRDRACASRAPTDEYRRPNKNPYEYGSVEEFKRKFPFDPKTFNPRKECKYISPNAIRHETDRYRRMYKDIRTPKECQMANGVWSPNSVNRNYRYESGVCWKNADHAHCSQHEVRDLLRPGNDKLENRESLIRSGSKKCNQDNKCTWVKLEKSYDCFAKDGQKEIKKNVSTPPEEMPSDITRNNIEQFLDDMYVRERVKKIGSYSYPYKDITAPQTTPLFGQGDRCNKAQPSKPLNVQNPDNAVNNAELNDIVPKKKEKHPNAYESIVEEEVQGQSLTPSVPQSIINMITKNWALKEAKGELVTNRGLLAWHSTGSGKTYTASGVIDAFWKSKRDIIFATSIDALASNGIEKFCNGVYNLFPDFKKEPFLGRTKEESLAKIQAAFLSRNIRFLSFAKFSNRLKKTIDSGILKSKGGNALPKVLTKRKQTRKKVVAKAPPKEAIKKEKNTKTAPPKQNKKVASITLPKEDFIDLNNTILIIDEVHNLFRPLPTQKKQHEYLKQKLIDPTKFPGLKIVILTATPGDNLTDVLMLLNMIRDPTHPVIQAPDISNPASVTKFKSDIRGLISYFDMSGDLTQFPSVKELDHILAPMGNAQFQKYVEEYKRTIKDKKVTSYSGLAKDNQLAKYWGPARKYSNMLYTYDKKTSVGEFSSKLPLLLSTIASYTLEKHYVYSAFYSNFGQGWSSQGILTIAKFLEKELHYEQLKLTDCSKYVVCKDKQCTVVRLPEKKKRYILLTSKEMGASSDSAGKQNKKADENVKKLLEIYNHPENRYGEYIHVMLASNAFNEGLDLKAVRHIHFFEPLVTMASDKQTLGRAARLCSHGDLNKSTGEWNVNIHRYMSDYPVTVELNTKTQIVSLPGPQQGPTNDERAQISAVENDITQLKQEYTQALEALELMKGITAKSKDVDAREKKEQLKTTAQTIKDALKSKELLLKEINKTIINRDKENDKLARLQSRQSKSTLTHVDPNEIKMIDEIIFNESREHMSDLMRIYQYMKEAAIDCRLLDKFHALSGNKITCEPYEKHALDNNEFKAKDISALSAFKKLNKAFF